ncbi:MAG: ABC-2 transporter permease [Peptostreptococcaceae bacterium]|nr:ABC-2 transporter permease [Peptostreptococcaceae bacterium]
MKAVKKIIEIDRLSIRPYLTLKNLFIFGFLSLFYIFISKNPMSALSMSVMFSLLFSSYPFLVGENSGIDGLYRVLGIRSGDVVLGRYLSAVFITVKATLVGGCFVLLSASLFPTEEMFFTIAVYGAVSFFLSTLMIGIQYPFYFKFGYLKAKSMIVYPFLGVGILSFALIRMREKIEPLISWMGGNLLLLIFLLLIFWLGMLLFSFALSKKWYGQREF